MSEAWERWYCSEREQSSAVAGKLARTMVVLSSDRLELRTLGVDDVTERYVEWLNDPGTNLYLGVRRFVSTPASVRDHIATFPADGPASLFGIFVSSSGEHIGNISLQDFAEFDMRAEIGILIGELSSRGLGIGTEAIGMICAHAFHTLGLHKVSAGVVVGNEGSKRAFEKAGFTLEGVLREQWRIDERWYDVYRFGLLASEYRGE